MVPIITEAIYDPELNSGCGGTTTPPYVVLTSPSSESGYLIGTLAGTVTLAAEASSPVGVKKVDFYIDGIRVGTDTSAPYKIAVASTGYSQGQHTVKAIMQDLAGELASSSKSVLLYHNIGTLPLPWWHDLVDAEVAHSNGYMGQNTVIILVDSGLTPDWHRIFPDPSRINTGNSKSFETNAWDGDTTNGHGTAMVSVILGYYGPEGVAVRGIAPLAQIIMVKAYEFGRNEDQLMQAYYYAFQKAIELKNQGFSTLVSVSASIGVYEFRGGYQYVMNKLDEMGSKGIPLIAAVGNAGKNSNIEKPAAYRYSTDVSSYRRHIVPVNGAKWTGDGGSVSGVTYPLSKITMDINEADERTYLTAWESSSACGSGLPTQCASYYGITGIAHHYYLPAANYAFEFISGTSPATAQMAGLFALYLGSGILGVPQTLSEVINFIDNVGNRTIYPGGPYDTVDWGYGLGQFKF